MTVTFEDGVLFLLDDPNRNAGLRTDHRALAELGCRLSLPLDGEGLRGCVGRAIANGVTLELLRAAFLHAVGYLGVVRVEPAFRAVRTILDAGKAGATNSPGIAKTHAARVADGTALYDRFDPGRAAKQSELYAVLSDRYYPMAMEFAGITLSDPAMDALHRQVMTIAMLSCLGGQEVQLKFHAGVALDRGVSIEDLSSVLVMVQAYAGLPRANAAALNIRDVVLAHPRVKPERGIA